MFENHNTKSPTIGFECSPKLGEIVHHVNVLPGYDHIDIYTNVQLCFDSQV